MTETATIYDVGNQVKTKEVKKDVDIQTLALRALMGKEVFIYLMTGVCLQGTLTAHDRFTVMLNDRQLIYKHAITTIQRANDTPYQRQNKARQRA